VRLIPNLNGTSRSELLEQRCRITDAIVDLRKILRSSWPNGRDYQTAPAGAMQADIDDWNAFETALAQWADRMMQEAEEVQR
jgi:hypothetical protein